ncbi:MAG: MBL fold metallo-hydrolase [Bacteroidaceae bacterium]|nr:MBL fold metallo-hydrolase [Bacteroidaceae bacterium]
MKLTFLGTGTSTGVPALACQCRVCSSTDSRDKRLRVSALLEDGDSTILLDCSPDIRQQLLRIGFQRPIDACFITHEHYDHVGGIDDLRPFTYRQSVPLYSDDLTKRHLEERLPYCLQRNVYPGVPQVTITALKPHDSVVVGKMTVQAFQIMHGQLPIFGYRIGDLAFITDMKTIPETELNYLHGVEVLIVNGLRSKPHNTHQSIQEAIDFSRKVGASRTYIIHMSHEAGLHEELEAQMPDGIYIAYDGLEIDI